jgi:hypothetical protein
MFNYLASNNSLLPVYRDSFVGTFIGTRLQLSPTFNLLGRIRLPFFRTVHFHFLLYIKMIESGTELAGRPGFIVVAKAFHFWLQQVTKTFSKLKLRTWVFD